MTSESAGDTKPGTDRRGAPEGCKESRMGVETNRKFAVKNSVLGTCSIVHPQMQGPARSFGTRGYGADTEPDRKAATHARPALIVSTAGRPDHAGAVGPEPRHSARPSPGAARVLRVHRRERRSNSVAGQAHEERNPLRCAAAQVFGVRQRLARPLCPGVACQSAPPRGCRHSTDFVIL